LQTIAGGEGNRGLGYIYAGRVISGFGIGAISAVAPAYVSECSPKQVRGRVTGIFQIMVAIGVMISYFVNCNLYLFFFARFILSNPCATVGIALHIHDSPKIWRIPFGVQLVPAGIMSLGLLTVPESPRWLASKDRHAEAHENLAYLRRRQPDSEEVLHELAEIEAALTEERDARANLGLREAFFGRGNFVRFLIAFFMFFLQQWCGQNSVSYYAPQIFTSVSRSLSWPPRKGSNVRADRVYWGHKLAPCVRHLRHSQGYRHGGIHILFRRRLGAQAAALRIRGRDGRLVLHRRRHSQDASTILNATD
jgi:MFS family permease